MQLSCTPKLFESIDVFSSSLLQRLEDLEVAIAFFLGNRRARRQLKCGVGIFTSFDEMDDEMDDGNKGAKENFQIETSDSDKSFALRPDSAKASIKLRAITSAVEKTIAYLQSFSLYGRAESEFGKLGEIIISGENAERNTQRYEKLHAGEKESTFHSLDATDFPIFSIYDDLQEQCTLYCRAFWIFDLVHSGAIPRNCPVTAELAFSSLMQAQQDIEAEVQLQIMRFRLPLISLTAADFVVSALSDLSSMLLSISIHGRKQKILPLYRTLDTDAQQAPWYVISRAAGHTSDVETGGLLWPGSYLLALLLYQGSRTPTIRRLKGTIGITEAFSTWWRNMLPHCSGKMTILEIGCGVSALPSIALLKKMMETKESSISETIGPKSDSSEVFSPLRDSIEVLLTDYSPLTLTRAIHQLNTTLFPSPSGSLSFDSMNDATGRVTCSFATLDWKWLAWYALEQLSSISLPDDLVRDIHAATMKYRISPNAFSKSLRAFSSENVDTLRQDALFHLGKFEKEVRELSIITSLREHGIQDLWESRNCVGNISTLSPQIKGIDVGIASDTIYDSWHAVILPAVFRFFRLQRVFFVVGRVSRLQGEISLVDLFTTEMYRHGYILSQAYSVQTTEIAMLFTTVHL